MLAFEHVSIAFDETVVLRDVSFVVPRGFTLIVFGMSGSGKSVLLKLALGLLRPDAGAIFVDGVRIDTMPEDELRRVRVGIGMLFQESALFDSLTVAENVAYGLIENSTLAPDAIRTRVEDVLGVIGMAPFIDRLPSELSGGQRRRVALARAMAAHPPLILLDEPTSGLDPITATTVDEVIIRMRDLDRATAVIVTHQVRDAIYVATHKAVRTAAGSAIVADANTHTATFIMLRDGGIYFQGTAADLQGSEDEHLRRFLGEFAQEQESGLLAPVPGRVDERV
jgi:phospholipid/cholesterol/gamma-HCH transport system ATP-binding protein